MKNPKESIKLLKSVTINTMNVTELEHFLPTLGMNNESTDQMPDILSEYFGWGLRFWQYPNQLSKLLKFISNINVSSYLEIGCRWGGTFIIINETLKQNNFNLKSYACDLISMSDVLTEYSNSSDFTYIQCDSQEENFISRFDNDIDFIFIDGDHSYNGVKTDYLNALKLNPKYIMFHDISCPDMGVYHFWNEIKNIHPNYEFVDQYELPHIKNEMLGIGIIEIK
jgi:cephalosporin hydroxylase